MCVAGERTLPLPVAQDMFCQNPLALPGIFNGWGENDVFLPDSCLALLIANSADGRQERQLVITGLTDCLSMSS